jgi:hypothetical protein
MTTLGSRPKIPDWEFEISDCQKSAVACATRATLANVKSCAMTARQPSVPNLIEVTQSNCSKNDGLPSLLELPRGLAVNRKCY